jgi:predicted alpha/beta-hydrolase family hydrolase
MARVFLINPPSPEPVRTPLLSFCHLAAALRAAGHEVALLDASAPHAPHAAAEIAARVAGFAPDLVGLHLKTLHVQPAYALARALAGLPLVAGGRSSGARVACRTAADVGAIGVLCLAFPLESPSRTGPPNSRLPELEAVDVPVLIVQGESDPFGMPPQAPGREVVRLKGNHSLRSDREGLRSAVRAWLEQRLSQAA